MVLVVVQKYTFSQSQRQRYCIYQRGTRIQWLPIDEEEEEETKKKTTPNI
jgi:allophanate hydrolase subunit 1